MVNLVTPSLRALALAGALTSVTAAYVLAEDAENAEEIGAMTDVPAATVRTRIYYGLRAARRQLKERGVTEAGLR